MGDFDNELDVQIKSKPEAETPKMYRVILHNDDYTTMEFVVEVLVKVFRLPAQDATRIMLDVHRKGQGQVGVFTRDIARTKVAQVHYLAKQREYPLKCTYEEA
ncbi:MAG: ATP-dependent Clp protease adapter ClpS [Spirochaetia bacterium]|jgi:ATP-dependent Clp protease adaptor protein ClpS